MKARLVMMQSTVVVSLMHIVDRITVEVLCQAPFIFTSCRLEIPVDERTGVLFADKEDEFA
jgi:hypothetical protein